MFAKPWCDNVLQPKPQNVNMEKNVYCHCYIPSFPAHWAQMVMKPSADMY